MPCIKFFKSQQTIQVKEGTELNRLPYLDAHTPLQFGCLQGICGVCVIKVLEGEENLSPMTKQEKATLQLLKLDDHRLACQCAVKGDVVIDL